MKNLQLSIFFLFFNIISFSQPTIEWQKCFGGSSSDFSRSIKETSDRDFIVAGETYSNNGDVSNSNGNYDFWIVKLNSSGNISWEKTYGGSNLDSAYDIKQTSDGGFIAVGHTYSSDGDVSSNHGGGDLWIVKLNSFGDISWTKTLGGSEWESGYCVDQTNNGNYIIVGESFSEDGDVHGHQPGGRSDMWIIKINSVGDTIWTRTFGGMSMEAANSVQQDSDGNFIILGYTASNDGDISENNGGGDVWVLKLNTDGNVLWSKTYGGTLSEIGKSIIQTSDGGYIVAGHTYSSDGDVTNNNGKSDFWVIKLTSAGLITWQKTFGGSSYDQSHSISSTVDGGYIIAGETQSDDFDVFDNKGIVDCLLIKINSVGDIIWTKTLGGTLSDKAYDVHQTSDRGYIITGHTSSDDGDVTGFHGVYDYWTVKLSMSPLIMCPNDTLLFGCSGTTINYDVEISNTSTISYSFSGATSGSGSGTGSGEAFNCGETLVEVTAHDESGGGNDASCSFTIEIRDTIAPTASNPASVIVECFGDIPSPDVSVVTDEADNCGSTTVTFVKDSLVGDDCTGSVVRFYEVADNCNNTTVVSQTFDINAKEFAAPAPTSDIVDCYVDIVLPTPPPVVDNCGNELTPTGPVESYFPACEGDVVYTWTYIDCAGNSSDYVHTVTIELIDFVMPPDQAATVNCLADAQVQPTPPVVYDFCGNRITPILISTPAYIPCEGDMAWVFNYTDCAGNSHDWTYIYTINIPDFTTPDDVSATVNCLADAQVQPTPPVVYDFCMNQITPTLTSTPADIPCEGEMAWVFTYTDCAANSHNWTYTYTINIPDFTPPADASATVNCLADAQVQPTPPVVYDFCMNQITPILTSTPADISCEGDMAWVFTYTDCAGNSHDWTYIYTINIPDFTPLDDASATVNCLADAQVQPTPPVLYDFCMNQITPILTSTPADISCEGEMAWVFTYTDCAANSHNWTYTYTINIPDFTPPADASATVNCLADAQVEPTPPEVYDFCGNQITPILISTPAYIPCEGDMAWVFTYTDCAGNSHDWTYTYTIDHFGSLTPPENQSSKVSCFADAIDPGAPADITDGCGRTVSAVLVGSTQIPDPVPCVGTIVWTYRYIACDGTTTTDWTYTYTIIDTIAPVFDKMPDPISDINCSDPLPVQEVITASDNNSGVTVTFSVAPYTVDLCAGYAITYFWTATDACGNSVEVSVTFNVLPDTTSPTADTLPDLGPFECYSEIPARDPYMVTGKNDNCGDVYVVVIWDSGVSFGCTDKIVRHYRIEDECKNVKEITQNIIIRDTTDPMITCPPDTMVQCLDDVPFAVTESLEAFDYCGSVNKTHIGDIYDPMTCMGTVYRTYEATDECGNSYSCTQLITIKDTISPTASNPAPIIIECKEGLPDPDITVVTDEADNCGVPVVAFVSDVSDGGSCPEIITRTYSITDSCDNFVNVEQLITINDNIAPTASNPAPIVIECKEELPAPDISVVTDEADNCGVPVVAFVSDVSYGGSCPETIIRTYSVTDFCGNSINVVQTITIDDITDPTASNPAPLVFECKEDLPDPDISVVTDEADNCGIPVVAFVSDVSDGNYCQEKITRTYSITDHCGNSIHVYQLISINDFTPPSILCFNDTTVQSIDQVPSVNIEGIAASDDCGNVVVSLVSDVLANNANSEVIIRTYRAEDNCGNFSDCMQLITIEHTNKPPVLVNPIPNQEINADKVLKLPISPVLGEVFDDEDDPSIDLLVTLEDGSALPDFAEYINDTLKVTPFREDIGCYEILVTATDSSSATATDQFQLCVLDWPVGFGENENGFGIRVYPNPSSGTVLIDLEATLNEIVEVRVTNVIGEEILFQEYLSLKQIKLDLRDQVSGFYFVKIIINENEITRKLILNRR